MFTFYEYNYVSPVGNGNVPCIYHMTGKHTWYSCTILSLWGASCCMSYT
jgi:hypothetical protein